MPFQGQLPDVYLLLLNRIQYSTTGLSIIIFYWNKILHITRNLIWFYETENEPGLYVLFFVDTKQAYQMS